MDTLAPQHIRAINAYMKGYSQKEALLEAGYSKSVAAHDSHTIFDRPDVKKEIERRKKIMAARNGVTEDWIVQRLMKIAEADVGDLIELDDTGAPFLNYQKLTPSMRAAISSLDVVEFQKGRGKGAVPGKKVKIGTADKLRAVELLMRIAGIGKERVEVSLENDLIERLQKGRNRLANEDREEA